MAFATPLRPRLPDEAVRRVLAGVLFHDARSVMAWCDVCRVFGPAGGGRCPRCQPSETGDLVGDLLAERSVPRSAQGVTDARLHGLLSDS